MKAFQLKESSKRLVLILTFMLLMSLLAISVPASAAVAQEDAQAVTVDTTGLAQVNGTDIPNNQLVLRMRALEGSFTVHNSQGVAEMFTVTVLNADPDYVTISEGSMLSKSTNSFMFELDVPASGSVTVDIEPWYYPDPNNYYFIAWSDNQDGPSPFKNKLLVKAQLINPILSVNAGDVVYGAPGTIGGAGATNQFDYPNDFVKDSHYQNYLSLLDNYSSPVFEVPGNHDLARGGWIDKSDARYGLGEALWNKYLGPTQYSFDVGNTNFLMTRFYYDMPDWTKRWGGNLSNGYLKYGTRGWQQTLPNDAVGDALYNWMDSTLTAAAGKTNRISVSHHNFNMFVPDGNSVQTARTLYSNRNVDYMISGHVHSYQTGTDSATGIPYLVIGTASHSNPAFALVHVNGSQITHQHMVADNINLSINYTNANNGTLTTNTATIQNSGYNMPFVRLKFKMSNQHAAYEAKDVATGAVIPSHSKRFDDYTVVYVETSIGNGVTRNVEVIPASAPQVPNVALNKTVSTSDVGSPYPGYGQAKAVDGIGGQWDNGWSTVTYEGIRPWLQVDLGAAYVISQVQLDDRPYDGLEGRPAWDGMRKNFEILASNDPGFQSYTVLGSVGNEPYAGKTWSSTITDPNAYRYIRFARTVTGYAFLSELRVYGVVEENAAQGKPVSTSDTEPSLAGYGPAKAVDGIGGDWNNGWSPVTFTGMSPWLQVDLGIPLMVSRVQVDDRPYDGQEGRSAWDGPRKNFEIRASNDPSFGTYTVLGSVGSTPYPGYVWSQVVTNPTPYRYIRYSRTDIGYSFLSELRVFTTQGTN